MLILMVTFSLVGADVKYSRGFKFLLGAALISTLGFKLLLKPATSSEKPGDRGAIEIG